MSGNRQERARLRRGLWVRFENERGALRFGKIIELSWDSAAVWCPQADAPGVYRALRGVRCEVTFEQLEAGGLARRLEADRIRRVLGTMIGERTTAQAELALPLEPSGDLPDDSATRAKHDQAEADYGLSVLLSLPGWIDELFAALGDI